MLRQVTYIDRKKPTNNVKGMDTVDNAEMPNKVIYESMHSITFWSRSGIKLTQNGFKLIKLNDSRRSQVKESIRNKNAIADIANIDVDNRLPLKTNVKYE